MIIQKITILLLLLITALFQQTIEEPSSSSEKIPSINISSLRADVITNGWNEEYLYYYRNYLLNTGSNLEEEKKRISALPGKIEKEFLLTLFLKREGNFSEMFLKLYDLLPQKPAYYIFYDELVFSAAAASQLSLVENYIESKKEFSEDKKNYLLALTASSRGNYKISLENFKECLRNNKENYFLLLHLSETYKNLGDYKQAKNELLKAKKAGSHNEWFLVDALFAEGNLNFFSGNYKDAEKLYQQGYLLSEKIGSVKGKARGLINLGILKDIAGDVESARNNFYKSDSLSGLINDLEFKAHALSELGVSYSFTNELIEAKNSYESSYEIYKRLGNKLRLSLLSENIGKIYMSIFDYRSAIKYYEEGLKFAGENKRAKVLNLRGLADVYANLSNYTKALIYYKEAQQLSSEIKELSLSAEIQSGLGSLNFNLSRYNSALQYYLEADELSRSLGNHYLTADIFHKTGLSYFELNDPVNAKRFFLDAINESAKAGDDYTRAVSLSDLAFLYLEENDIPNAEKFIAQAKAVSADYNWEYLIAGNSLVEGKISEKKGDISRAQLHYRDALQIAKKLNEFSLQIEAYFALAKLFDEKNLVEAAESYYTSAVNVIEDVSRPLFEEEEVQISYRTGKQEVYNRFAELYLNKEDYVKAFELIERSRSRNMLQNLNNLKLSSIYEKENLIDKIYEYEWVIHSGIYSKEEADSVKKLYSSLKSKLIQLDPRGEKYLREKRNFTVSQLQRELNRGEHLISFYSAGDDMFIFNLSKDEFSSKKINIRQDELKKLIASVSPYFDEAKNNQAVFNQDLFSFNAKAANNLYKKLFQPAVADIPKNEKLIFILPVELAPLPLEFLVTEFDEEISAYNYKNQNYLIYDYSISYIPSASSFIEQRENLLLNDDKILVVGNPSINSSAEGFAERRGLLEETGGIPRNIALLPLKYSGEEVNQIEAIISADKVLLENDATESNFKQNAELSKIIHLSTHSFLYNKQPVIFFSNSYDPENDGFLELGEIVQLKLNSDLVVLSSCNSGLGELSESEGVLGMTKAFYEAGAKSVVVSLWEVNDKFTSRLMTLFYEELSKGLDKPEALRQAKIEFIKEHSPNPFFWSAFVLSGNIAPLELKTKNQFSSIFISMALIIGLAGAIIYWRKKKA